MKMRASFSENLGDGTVRCRLCPKNCTIFPSKSGDCKTRTNEDGSLTVNTYGALCSANDDPVEKKPLFHFMPGTRTFSVASAGCNLVCPFCQNHSLSQVLRADASPVDRGTLFSPDNVVRAALNTGCKSIAFTYSEPILQFEFARDVAKTGRPSGLGMIFVTNGQAQAESAKEMTEFLDGANVDLKCFDAKKYKEILGGTLKSTTRTIETFLKNGVWVEVTTLVIPGFNDSETELTKTARFIAGLSPQMPWHVSRFHPDFDWQDVEATPPETLTRAREIGLEQGLHHVYVGNLPGDEGEKTRCPKCQSVVIDRRGYRITGTALTDGACSQCGESVPGVCMNEVEIK